MITPYTIAQKFIGRRELSGPENTTAPGHVGFYVFHHKALVYILGGNQDDSVCISEYPISRVIGVRRLE